MAATLQMKRRFLATIVALGVLLLVLNGCRFRPTPLAAFTYSDEQGEVVEVTIRASDARTIQRRQLYIFPQDHQLFRHHRRIPSTPLNWGKAGSRLRFPDRWRHSADHWKGSNQDLRAVSAAVRILGGRRLLHRNHQVKDSSSCSRLSQGA